MPENTGSSLVTVRLSEEEKPTETDQSNYRHSRCQRSDRSHVFQSSSQHVWSLMMNPKGVRCHVKNTHFWYKYSFKKKHI